MKIQSINKVMFNRNYIWVITLITCLFSCQDEKIVNESNEDAIVRISIDGIETQTESNGSIASTNPAKLASTQAINTSDDVVQNLEVPFDDSHSVQITITEQRNSVNSSNSKLNKIASTTTTGPVKWLLEAGVKYRVVVYNSAGNYLNNYEYVVGTAKPTNGITLAPNQKYTFVVYSIRSKESVPAAPTASLNSAILPVNGNVDFMYFIKENMTVSAGVNDLAVLLKHSFSQIITTINASAIGDVTAATANVKPHFNVPEIKLNNGSINYLAKGGTWSGDPTPSGSVVSFPNLSLSKVVSDSIMVCNNGSSTSTLSFPHITIKGMTKYNVQVPNISLKPGRRYVLTMNLTSFGSGSNGGGGQAFSPGNLIYNRSNDSYSFATTQADYGSYFFPNYTKPKRLDIANITPNNTINGSSGDPCSKVLPLNSWRLPTETELMSIKESTASRISGHAGPNINSPVRFVATYDGTNSTSSGMFLGTQLDPGTNRYSYMFFTYGGAIRSNHTSPGEFGFGYYLIKSSTAYKAVQFGNVDTFDFVTALKEEAFQVRCVKVNP
ncbi:hypothetical protein [Sphingobacterium hungaricum]